MKIDYKHGHINDPDGSFFTTELGDFILLLPDIGLTIKKVKIIPPVSVLNELLGLGKCDAGMSGFFEWTPIQINTKSYDEFREQLEKTLDAKVVDFGNQNISLKKWTSQARSYFRK